MATLVSTSCPLCGAHEPRPHQSVPDRFHVEEGDRYDIVRCQRCGLLYLDPRPAEEESAAFYAAAGYQPFVSTRARRGPLQLLYTWLRAVNARWKRGQIERLRPAGGSLLDVGCGTGEFLRAMRAGGWTVCGVERDEAAAAWGRKAYGLAIEVATLETLQAQPSSFDVVCLWHVLEHLYHPHDALDRVRSLLAREGMLVLASPNPDSLDARFYGSSWIAYDAPRHLHHWSLDPLTDLCREHGLERLRVQSLPMDALFNTLESTRLEWRRRARGAGARALRTLALPAVALAALLAGPLRLGGRNARGASTLLTFWQRAEEGAP